MVSEAGSGCRRILGNTGCDRDGTNESRSRCRDCRRGVGHPGSGRGEPVGCVVSWRGPRGAAEERPHLSGPSWVRSSVTRRRG